jgi:CheY-like chemotaxis protein
MNAKLEIGGSRSDGAAASPATTGSQTPELTRAAMDRLLEGCEIFGRDWRCLYANDAAARQAGRSRPELVGSTLKELYPGVETTETFAAIRRCMEERAPARLVDELVVAGGARCAFELAVEPVADGVLVRAVELAAPRLASQPAVAAGRGTILLVEDDGLVRKLIDRILRGAGYRVLVAENGEQALLACERHGGVIDLLLTDVVMPEMSGPELADRLARLRPGLRILFMSGYAESAIVHHGVLEPDTQFIGKPFSAEALTAKVRQVIALARP